MSFFRKNTSNLSNWMESKEAELQEKAAGKPKGMQRVANIVTIVVVAVFALIIFASCNGGSDEDEEPQESVETSQEPTEPAERTKTDEGLDLISARYACVELAEEEVSPLSIKVHTFLGAKQEVIHPDYVAVLYDATVTNVYGAELSYEVLCHVSGTSEDPVVDVLEIR